MKIINNNFVKFQTCASLGNPSVAIDPMQVDAPIEENENNVEELYEVDIDSFVRTNIILWTILLNHN